jgi:predicted kinase
MMPNLVMLSGLPASGKTTLAKKIVANGSKFVRINRDMLRSMLFDGEWSKGKEALVIQAEQHLADLFYAQGYNCVIDDTNLTEKHHTLWKEFACVRGINFEHVPMNVPIEECIERDSKRQEKVGPLVIQWMALRSGLINWPNKPIVICDIDGTLADAEHRLHHILNEPKNWGAFFDPELIARDGLITIVADWLYELYKDNTIVLISGRAMDKGGDSTLEWLKKHRIPYHYIFLRQRADFREDWIMKEEILKLMPMEKVAFAIEDRLQVVEKCWRKNNIRVFQVSQNDGNY